MGAVGREGKGMRDVCMPLSTSERERERCGPFCEAFGGRVCAMCWLVAECGRVSVGGVGRAAGVATRPNIAALITFGTSR